MLLADTLVPPTPRRLAPRTHEATTSHLRSGRCHTRRPNNFHDTPAVKECTDTPGFLPGMTTAWRSAKVKRPREAVAHYVQILTEELSDDNPGLEFYFCGSWRRGADLVGDLDVVVISESLFTPSLFDDGVTLPSLPGLTYQRRGPRLAAAELLLPDGPLHLDLFVFRPESRGCALLALTGPFQWNQYARSRAKYRCRPSLSLSQEALKIGDTGEVLPCDSEEAVYLALGMPYETPQQRQRWVRTT
jgi:DNA polymerase/3'-5' exonuclease PolX